MLVSNHKGSCMEKRALQTCHPHSRGRVSQFLLEGRGKWLHGPAHRDFSDAHTHFQLLFRCITAPFFIMSMFACFSLSFRQTSFCTNLFSKFICPCLTVFNLFLICNPFHWICFPILFSPLHDFFQEKKLEGQTLTPTFIKVCFARGIAVLLHS